MKRNALIFTASAVLTFLFAGTSAHAQWTKGNTYYGVTFVTNPSAHTTCSTTSPVGTVTVTSTPIMPSGYDTPHSGVSGVFFTGTDTTTTSQTFQCWLEASTSATYSNTTTATAKTSYGSPTSP